jgi:hypothetical protein
MKMLYFKNGAEDAGIFPLDRLIGVEAGDQTVTFHFDNGISSTTTANNVLKHTVVCATADGVSANVMKDVALACGGAGNIHSNVITVRDDIAGTGVAGITGVTSITFDYTTAS